MPIQLNIYYTSVINNLTLCNVQFYFYLTLIGIRFRIIKKK